MLRKTTDLAIVNRGFWEDDTNKVIGEALLVLSERVSDNHSVCVITQSYGNLKQRLSKANRGRRVKLLECKSHTTPSNRILVRSLDTLFFGFFVFYALLRSRPKTVYVATDPPILVPFIVFIYCSLFSSKYFYHLQDLHPEATDLVIPVARPLFKIMRFVDSLVVRHAEAIITLTDEMSTQISYRSSYEPKVILLTNPAGFDLSSTLIEKGMDFVFCGNAGRVQRIPLLIDAISEYYKKGGNCHFTFIGGGKYSPQLKGLDRQYSKVTYHGPMPPTKASDLVGKHRWALLPIDDEVTKFAFPSKTSTYLLSGCRILAICGVSTSVGKWVMDNDYGIVCEPNIETIVDTFFTVENQFSISKSENVTQELYDKYSFETFSTSLINILFART
ncbi:MAG: glycosyltransferase [Candidatus Thiodiazotropha sp. (ex Monitilora ramsayi)]|nr:glycosyltransferase [Candidatus Thiodiazotropha sp. (ex Monitilora ramsayi)]